MRDRVRWLLEVLGFTPTQREAYLARRLDEASKLATAARRQVARVERLVAFREGLGAGTVELDAVRQALSGEERAT